MDNNNDNEPKLWVTVLKLALGALILLVLIGLGLYYTAKFQTYAPPEQKPAPDWGIATDSPIRSNR